MGRLACKNDRLKPVASAGYRLDEPLALVGKRTPQFADALHQDVIGDGDVRPHRREQFVLRDRPPGILQQEAQHRECLRPQDNFAAIE